MTLSPLDWLTVLGLDAAGGWSGLQAKLPADMFSMVRPSTDPDVPWPRHVHRRLHPRQLLLVDGPGPRAARLIGVYDADGGLLGEMAFVTGRILGLVRCALCEIMHGVPCEKPVFRRLNLSLGVEVRMLHRNEQPPHLRRFTEGNTPRIVAETPGGYETLLTPRTSSLATATSFASTDSSGRCSGGADRP